VQHSASLRLLLKLTYCYYMRCIKVSLIGIRSLYFAFLAVYLLDTCLQKNFTGKCQTEARHFLMGFLFGVLRHFSANKIAFEFRNPFLSQLLVANAKNCVQL